MKKYDIAKEITKNLKKDNKKKGINDNKGKCIEPNVSHKRKQSSIAWRECAFKFKPGDNTKVICGQCELEGNYHEQTRGEGTSSLRRHLEVKHPTFWGNINCVPDGKQPKMSKYTYSQAE